ncbi:Chemotaxis protein CheW [Methyloligella halotolerans]|uniref:Chemotaxis protein CheW n=1 Tax=Methyloligella halotolerans TaxID=1177755 RepID=A0A1E2S065_9HYPH|nr:chemotaxis protein CheW [Methyloligella halotolerans]ODA67715.1 Chemotaxis protein CheW [Methyloligella halotolerans]
MNQQASDGIRRQAAEGYVTAMVGDQLFGLALTQVRDVFIPKGICRVPLAPPSVAGLLSLRGRVVTAIDLRRRLGLPLRGEGEPSVALGIERGAEIYGLIADRIGNVLRPSAESFEPTPINLTSRWSEVCAGLYRLDQGVMAVLDVESLLDAEKLREAA